jgi:hypothetical protein
LYKDRRFSEAMVGKLLAQVSGTAALPDSVSALTVESGVVNSSSDLNAWFDSAT